MLSLPAVASGQSSVFAGLSTLDSSTPQNTAPPCESHARSIAFEPQAGFPSSCGLTLSREVQSKQNYEQFAVDAAEYSPLDSAIQFPNQLRRSSPKMGTPFLGVGQRNLPRPQSLRDVSRGRAPCERPAPFHRSAAEELRFFPEGKL